MWCDSCGQFFHAGCLDVPFAETWGGKRHQHNISPAVCFESFHPEFICQIKKIKKTLRTENRIILTPGSFETSGPDYKYLSMVNTVSLNLAVSRSSVFSYMPFSREMRRLNIYNKH